MCRNFFDSLITYGFDLIHRQAIFLGKIFITNSIYESSYNDLAVPRVEYISINKIKHLMF